MSVASPPDPNNAVSTMVAPDLTAFRTAVASSFVPLRLTSSHPDSFRGVLRSIEAADVHLTDLRAHDHVVERTPELISRDDRRYFKVSVMLSGSCLLIQDHRETVLRPGDLAVYDTSRPYTLVFDEEVRTMVVMFPTELAGLPAEAVGQLTAVRMPGSEGLGAVVAPYLARLADNLEQLSGATGARLAQTGLDLVTTLFAHELDLDRVGRDPREALLGRIRAHIEENLGSPDLGPTSIAAAHFISTRHLHGLFQAQGTTVSTWIRIRRLERCRRDLLNPALADRPVSGIAARWGFADPAHFSRAFRAQFGTPPSELRTRV